MQIERSEPSTVTIAFIMRPEEWQAFYEALKAKKKTFRQRELINRFKTELCDAYPEIESGESSNGG